MPAVKLSPADALLLQTHRKLCSVMGADLGKGWEEVFEYMADNVAAIRAYREELARLRKVIAKEADAAKKAHITDIAYQAMRKRDVHNFVKGRLGERFLERWKDWRLIRSSYEEIARRLARTWLLQGTGRWEVVTVSGRLYLGGGETWDQAVLLVLRGSNPPKARLFMAAQMKTAIESRALDQTLNDMLRETSKPNLRIVAADGTESWYLLEPLPAGQASHRWIANTVGTPIPAADLAALRRAGVRADQLTIPVTVTEFNVLTDRLIEVFCDALTQIERRLGSPRRCHDGLDGIAAGAQETLPNSTDPPKCPMPALVFRDFGDAKVLRYEQVPDAMPGTGQTLMRMKATRCFCVQYRRLTTRSAASRPD